MSECYNSLIIGAGNIGTKFDKPNQDIVLTHAHAYHQSPKFRLVGIVDTNLALAKKETKKWGCKAYDKIETAFNENKIDVVSICSPTETHLSIFKQLPFKKIKLCFLEKPIAKNTEESKEILSIAKRTKIPVQVNYSRRFIPQFSALKKEIYLGNFGEFLSGTGYYSKGILNNGSHFLDLLHFLVAQTKSVKILDHCVDFKADDPSATLHLTLNNGKNFFLHHVDYRHHYIGQLDLFFSKTRILISDLGSRITFFETKNNPLFPGFKKITKIKEMEVSFSDALKRAVENIAFFLKGKEELICPLSEALESTKPCLTTLDAIKKQSSFMQGMQEAQTALYQ
jgi:predicted dehydrogenase